MTRQNFADLVRRTLAEMRLGGYILATLDVVSPVGVVCFIVAFASGEPAKRIYLDLYEYDEDRLVEEIKRQLTTEESQTRVRPRW